MSSNNSAETRALSSVFIGNVHLDIKEDQLKDLFSECGPVVNFKLFCDKTGKSQGYAFCEYKEHEIAVSAVRNLGRFQLKGQLLEVDIATSEKCRQDLEKLQGSVIDSSDVLDGSTEKAPEEISKAVASLPAEQMFELMKQMKMCIENNPQEARNLLLQNPQLAYALLQAQVVMRVVDPEVAVKILDRTPAPLEPDCKQVEQMSVPNAVEGMPLVNPESRAAPSVPLVPQPVPNPHIRPAAVSLNLFSDQDLRPTGDQDLRQLPPMLGDRDLRPQPPVAADKDFRLPVADQDFRALPLSTATPDSRPFDPRFRNTSDTDVPQPVAPPFGRPANVDPRTAFEGRNVAPPARAEDPRRASMSAALSSRLSAAGPALQNLGQPMLPMVGIPNAGTPMLPEDQEKAALIMQVLQLTDQQIALLPAEQRTSIMVLKDQLVRSQLL